VKLKNRFVSTEGFGSGRKPTPRLKYIVRPIDPKYATVNGRRGVDIKCFTYVIGPNIAPQEHKKRRDPSDHLM
jgi:hypothetical protein